MVLAYPGASLDTRIQRTDAVIDTYFDPELASSSHFTLYPNLLPWVGAGYRRAELKILLLGESHYLPQGVTYHHDAHAWYSGLEIPSAEDLKWMTTRSIIRNGLKREWKGPSKTIYRNLSTALKMVGFAPDAAPFENLAYMNFFQRPAEKTGDSIKVKEIDRQVSAATVAHVVSCLRPNLVVFCSSLAWRACNEERLLPRLKSNGCVVGTTPHPASAWWNRQSLTRGGKSGRQVFCDLVQQSLGAPA